MGKSRSASVIIAYLMSLSPTTTPTIALASLRKARPMAEPNSGFMQQLELYHQMGCPNDVNIHPMYQRWLYQQEVKLSIACGRAPESIRFEDETADGTGRGEVEIRCRKCRRSLATSAYLIPHSPKTSSVSHNNENDQEADMKPISSLGPTNSIPQQQCAHLFLDPLSWMRPELEQGKLDGRLECPNTKCKTNVGKYAWQGMKCSCRAWVVPAITLARGRVDEIESRPTPFMAAANGGGKI
ncbi:MAG: tyrosine protein phosphatase yvh1 [Icmadophila ericetorum]|nr:tyrosine protein phosphatase yvh1 [Icmadophila ericetorum]